MAVNNHYWNGPLECTAGLTSLITYANMQERMRMEA